MSLETLGVFDGLVVTAHRVGKVLRVMVMLTVKVKAKTRVKDQAIG